MSAARTALLGLVDALAAAVEPTRVEVAEEANGGREAEPESPRVTIRPTSLSRTGRSRRDGAVLDLELSTAVAAEGSAALELTERMLTALELDSRYTVEPEPEPKRLGFRVRMPVAVRLDEPVRWRVTEPLRLDVRVARSLAGIVLDADGQGVPEARVSAALGGAPVVTDAQGRFRLLVADAPRQDLLVEVQGATRTIDAATDTAPVVIRWE
jgi:hypothetical protein